MEMIIDLLKIVLPAILVLYAAYLIVRSFTTKQLEEYKYAIRQKNMEIVTPIRLQAYERVCLLLERIAPSNLIPRLNNNKMTAKDLQSALISEIRGEYNHNLSQQVYMSGDAWMYVSSAVEQLISMINEAGNQMEEKATGLDLAKAIFEKSINQDGDTLKNALSYIKEEIREVF